MSERFEMLEETLRICLQMWSDDDGPYERKHYRLAETRCGRVGREVVGACGRGRQ